MMSEKFLLLSRSNLLNRILTIYNIDIYMNIMIDIKYCY